MRRKNPMVREPDMFDWKKRLFPTSETAGPATAFRLLAWPDLPQPARTAAVYQALSRMSQGPVTLQWFVDHSRLRPREADQLFGSMIRNGQLKMIDLAKFQEAHPACV
jgi:hypothetical protein